jgi:hypothetical protein
MPNRQLCNSVLHLHARDCINLALILLSYEGISEVEDMRKRCRLTRIRSELILLHFILNFGIHRFAELLDSR